MQIEYRSFYLVRHATTELNDDRDCIRGWKNVPLSRTGWEESFDLAKKLKAARVNIGIIFSSDLSRATATADAIAAQLHVPVVKTQLLRPWNLGVYTGKPWKEVHDNIVQFAEYAPTIAVPDGESFSDFRNRAFNGLRFALSESRGKSMAIVTHHRVERLYKATTPDSLPNNKMFLKGDPPGTAEKVTIDLRAIAGAQPVSVYAGADVVGPDRVAGKS